SCIFKSRSPFKRGVSGGATQRNGRRRGGFLSSVLCLLMEGSQLWGQATKCMWWMPRRLQAMKDVAACEKLRGAGKQALIRRCPNGETRPVEGHRRLNT